MTLANMRENGLQLSTGRMTYGRGSPQHQRSQVPQEARRDGAARDRDAKGRLKGSHPLPAKAVVTVGGIDLKFEIDGDIEVG
jgi:Family of unknown function (DUF6494)